MRVSLIGWTVAHSDAMEYVTDDVWEMPQAEDMDSIGEFAGRACYQSWDRPNPKTANNDDYLGNVIGQGHESVLAHASASFYAEGVSRSLTHELIRSRFLAFSELSQRYVDMKTADFVIPPALQGDDHAEALLKESWESAKQTYKVLCYWLENTTDLSKKQVREAARAVLPNMAETKIVVSGNMRAWRDFLKQRLSPHADAEIQAFAQEIKRQLLYVAPNSMQGI
jgi:thymidylate synthase (FAD)